MYEEVIADCRRAIDRDPRRPEPYLNLGRALQAQGKLDQAIAAYGAAIANRPDYSEAYFSLGNALQESGRPDGAFAAYRHAIAARPDFALAHLHLGNLLLDQGRFGDATERYQRAVALKPDLVGGYSNLGHVLRRQGRIDEAIAACRHAIAVQPDFAGAHFNLAIALLLSGDLRSGWQEYEWRWRRGAKEHVPRNFPQPRWRGQELTGKTLLLHSEQGLGDTLQFARFAPVMARRGASVMLAVPKSLVALLGSAQWAGVTVNDGTNLSGFDFEIPLMSLPAALELAEDAIPSAVPYLLADARRAAAWRARLGEEGYRIGIAWQGKPDPKVDLGRSFALNCFAPLAAMPGVRLISLQKHHGLDQLSSLPPGMQVETPGADFDSGADAFLDTAAIVMNLDLVITADTALAHLAGAMARPTWLALQSVPDWRWMMKRETSPWYPTLRMFRQRAAGEWDQVFADMARELRGQMTSNSSSSSPRSAPRTTAR